MTDWPGTRGSLIVRLADARDADAWRAFIAVYAPAVITFARRQGLQPADAADVAQDVCRAVADALRVGKYDVERGRFRGWLFAVVRNQVRMFRRSQARRPLGVPLADDIADGAEAETWDLECRRRLFAWACDKVKPQVAATTWSAFWRTAVDEASGEAVAKETGLSVAAVYLAKSRVLAKLRHAVSAIEEE